MPQSLPVNSQDSGKNLDRRSSASRTFLARATLILAFPFWFPRLFFWLVVEFVRYHFTDWVPRRDSAGADRQEGLSEGRPVLTMIQGEGVTRGPHVMAQTAVPSSARLTLVKSDRRAS